MNHSRIFYLHLQNQLIKYNIKTKTAVHNEHHIDNSVPIYNENKITAIKTLENFNKKYENIKFTMKQKKSTSISGHEYIQLTRLHRNRHMPQTINKTP